MIDLAKKQAFWCEQLPNFEAKYWLPSHFEFLIFDKDQGNYVIKEDLDPSFEDEATEIFHRVNTGWAMWKKAINFNDQQAEIDSLKAENAALKEKLAKIESDEFVVVPVDQLNQWGHMANYAQEYGCPECFEARGYAHSLACEINEYFKPVEAAQENSHE